MSAFSDRLSLAFHASGKSRAELAAALVSPKGKMGVSVQAVGDALSGKSGRFNAENAARAARALGVSIYWLCTGEGSMRDSDLSARSAAEASVLTALGRLTDQQVAEVADRLSILVALVGRGRLQVQVADEPPGLPTPAPAGAH